MYLLRCLELIPKFHSLFRATEAYRLKQELDNAREREKDARGRLMEITQQSVLHDKVFFFSLYCKKMRLFCFLSNLAQIFSLSYRPLKFQADILSYINKEESLSTVKKKEELVQQLESSRLVHSIP